MNLFKWSLVFLLTVFGQQLFAEDSASNKEDSETISASKISLGIPFYSEVILRQYNAITAEDSPKMQLRGTLGAKFLEDKLDTSLTLGINKSYETSKLDGERTIYPRTPQLEVTYSLYSNDLLSVYPYIIGRLPVEDKHLAVDLGLYVSANKDLAISSGEISLGGSADFSTSQSTQQQETIVSVDDAQKQAIENAYGLVPNDDGDLEVNEDYAHFSTSYSVWIGYTPSSFSNLSVQAETTYSVSISPTYVGSKDIIRRVYDTSSGVDNSLALAYKITDNLSLENVLSYSMDGFFNEGANVTNMVELSYDLL